MKALGWKATGALLVAAFAACSTPPPPSVFETEFDEQSKPWQEMQTQLPAVPADRDLVVFPVSGGSQYRFAIDATSISIGTDGVYRYALVATSPQGVRNVTYEGIRCLTGEKKIYAIGASDNSWTRSRMVAWTPIQEVGNNRQQAALMKEYFCIDRYPTQSVAEILARLRVTLPSTIL